MQTTIDAALDFPVFYNQRVRPADAAAKLFLHDLTGSYDMPGIDDPLTFTFELLINGSKNFNDRKIFYLSDQKIKNKLQLTPHQKYFSFSELSKSSFNYPEKIAARLKFWQELKPLNQQLLFSLPTLSNGWLSLSHLLNDSLEDEFTLYPYISLKQLSDKFRQLVEAKKIDVQTLSEISSALKENYQQNHYKFKHLPTLYQLKVESFYLKINWFKLLLAAYALTFLLYLLTYAVQTRSFNFWLTVAYFVNLSAIAFNIFFLGLRVYILDRAPIANMLETAIYIPIIISLAALYIYSRVKKLSILITASLFALLIISFSYFFEDYYLLQNTQPVLNSNFWLITHVMLVVGSYGFFFLASCLGHLATFNEVFYSKPTGSLTKVNLKLLYTGLVLLTLGTLLGGVWASQSWGRFWDWDPKESWAFLTICFYVTVVHAYSFNKIADFTLHCLIIIGAAIVSFTWYGVNYLLNAGLHSYGFGTGGELFYYLFLLFELCWVIFMSYKQKRPKKSNQILKK